MKMILSMSRGDPAFQKATIAPSALTTTGRSRTVKRRSNFSRVCQTLVIGAWCLGFLKFKHCSKFKVPTNGVNLLYTREYPTSDLVIGTRLESRPGRLLYPTQVIYYSSVPILWDSDSMSRTLYVQRGLWISVSL
jgi:hypothetical protein